MGTTGQMGRFLTFMRSFDLSAAAASDIRAAHRAGKRKGRGGASPDFLTKFRFLLVRQPVDLLWRHLQQLSKLSTGPTPIFSFRYLRPSFLQPKSVRGISLALRQSRRTVLQVSASFLHESSVAPLLPTRTV